MGDPNRDVDEGFRRMRVAEARRTLKAIREAPGGGSGRPSIRGSRKMHAGDLGTPTVTGSGETVRITSQRAEGQVVVYRSDAEADYVRVADHRIELVSVVLAASPGLPLHSAILRYSP